jgi:hypothetical protein
MLPLHLPLQQQATRSGLRQELWPPQAPGLVRKPAGVEATAVPTGSRLTSHPTGPQGVTERVAGYVAVP